jgi:hypothetical protein
MTAIKKTRSVAKRYLSVMPFPNSAYAIFCVFSATAGQVASGPAAFNFGLGIQYSGLMTAAQSNSPGAWTVDSNWATSIRDKWVLATMLVNGSTCAPLTLAAKFGVALTPA